MNAERDYIVSELRKSRVIGDVTSYQSGQRLNIERVNRYVTDRSVSVANLTVNRHGIRTPFWG
jgi:hypothetical protein